jgi:hypothetical protein
MAAAAVVAVAAGGVAGFSYFRLDGAPPAPMIASVPSETPLPAPPATRPAPITTTATAPAAVTAPADTPPVASVPVTQAAAAPPPVAAAPATPAGPVTSAEEASPPGLPAPQPPVTASATPAPKPEIAPRPVAVRAAEAPSSTAPAAADAEAAAAAPAAATPASVAAPGRPAAVEPRADPVVAETARASVAPAGTELAASPATVPAAPEAAAPEIAATDPSALAAVPVPAADPAAAPARQAPVTIAALPAPGPAVARRPAPAQVPASPAPASPVTEAPAAPAPAAAAASLPGPTPPAVAEPSREPPIAETTRAAPEPAAKAPPPEVRAPVFDLVRVERDGSTLVAGRAEPGAEVAIALDGTPRTTVRANRRGEFVAFLSTDPGREAQELRLIAREGGPEIVSESTVVILAAGPDEDGAPAAPAVIEASPEKIAVLQPARPGIPDQIALDTISYDRTGDVVLAGRGRPRADVRVYADNLLVASATVADSGAWSAVLNDLAQGRYVLRVDEIDKQGSRVSSRMETPFQRDVPDVTLAAEERPAVTAEAPAAPEVVVVQPGNSLWRLARLHFGQGARYTLIFTANRDRIKDPDLIYPGQIFDLPKQ